jgi:23S rRNA (uracil1939-C5)-methyltransferase
LLLTIEKLIYGGDGLSRLPADSTGPGKAVFVPFVLPGEEIEASIAEQRSGFARAVAERIIKSSPHRLEPKCPYFGPCGGCHYQHIDYEHQLWLKKEILRETLKRTAKLELDVEIQVHPSPPWNYRNRTRLQIQTSPTFQAGYFRMRSHELLAVEECPISSPLINRAIEQLWQSGRANKVPNGIREIEFFANSDDLQLLIELTCKAETRRAAVRSWAEEICSAMPEIAGMTALRENPKGAFPEKFLTVGADYLTYQTQRAAYRVSTGSFFQVNRHVTEELVNIVTAGQTGEQALDLYAGVGLFSTALARDMRHIVSVESSQTSTSDLAYNLPSNGVALQATTEQYLSGAEGKRRVGTGVVLPHGTHNRPDLAVVDPPRNGLGERVARMVATLGAPRVVYVSCDPATLARDLVVLLASGYHIKEVHMVDLFPHTYHLETVVHLVR